VRSRLETETLALDDRMLEIRTEIDRLKAEADSCRRWIRDLSGSYLNDMGKQRDRVMEMYPNLALAIRNRIAIAHVVFVIVSPHTSYRPWTEFEYQEAFVLRKPTFGMLLPGLAEMPPDLQRFGIMTCAWNPAAVCESLRRVEHDQRSEPDAS
jgi:hypothetical protein